MAANFNNIENAKTSLLWLVKIYNITDQAKSARTPQDAMEIIDNFFTSIVVNELAKPEEKYYAVIAACNMLIDTIGGNVENINICLGEITGLIDILLTIDGVPLPQLSQDIQTYIYEPLRLFQLRSSEEGGLVGLPLNITGAAMSQITGFKERITANMRIAEQRQQQLVKREQIQQLQLYQGDAAIRGVTLGDPWRHYMSTYGLVQARQHLQDSDLISTDCDFFINRFCRKLSSILGEYDGPNRKLSDKAKLELKCWFSQAQVGSENYKEGNVPLGIQALSNLSFCCVGNGEEALSPVCMCIENRNNSIATLNCLLGCLPVANDVMLAVNYPSNNARGLRVSPIRYALEKSKYIGLFKLLVRKGAVVTDNDVMVAKGYSEGKGGNEQKRDTYEYLKSVRDAAKENLLQQEVSLLRRRLRVSGGEMDVSLLGMIIPDLAHEGQIREMFGEYFPSRADEEYSVEQMRDMLFGYMIEPQFRDEGFDPETYYQDNVMLSEEEIMELLKEEIESKKDVLQQHGVNKEELEVEVNNELYEIWKERNPSVPEENVKKVDNSSASQLTGEAILAKSASGQAKLFKPISRKIGGIPQNVAAAAAALEVDISEVNTKEKLDAVYLKELSKYDSASGDDARKRQKIINAKNTLYGYFNFEEDDDDDTLGGKRRTIKIRKYSGKTKKIQFQKGYKGKKTKIKDKR